LKLIGGFAKRESLCLSGDCFSAAADPATLAGPRRAPQWTRRQFC